MGIFHTNLEKGDLILVSHKDKDKFDGAIVMMAKEEMWRDASIVWGCTGDSYGFGQCIIFNTDEFVILGDFYEQTGLNLKTISGRGEQMAVQGEGLIVPDDCEWIIKDLHVGWNHY